MKKILCALMLTLSMILTSFVGVGAYSDVVEDSHVSEAVTILSALDILNGYPDGTFDPDATVTRAEMAKIICETLGYGNMSINQPIFEDVSTNHWAAGYIDTAYGLGIINGYGNGKFGPEDTVTYEQAIKMIVCALGYEPMAASKGGWSTGYTAVAATIGLSENVNSSSRGDIAVLIYNALTTPVMEQTSYGSDAEFNILDGTGNKEYKTILTAQNIYIATGIVGDKVSLDEVEFTISKDSKDGEFEIAEKPVTFLIGDTNICDYIYQEVEAYVVEDDGDYTVIAIKNANKSETFTLVSDDIKEITDNKIEYYVGSKTKTVSFDEDALIEYNRCIVDSLDEVLYDGDEIKEDIELVFVENDGDRKYDVIVATLYTSIRLDLVDANKDKMVFGSKTVTFDFDNEDNTYIFVDVEGNELTIKDFKKDDVVAYVADENDIRNASYIKVIKLDDAAIVGKVSSVDSANSTITINGDRYKVMDDIWDEVCEPGTEGTFYIGITGKVIYFDGSYVAGKYGYILAAGVMNDAFEDTVQIKLLTEDGIETYTLTEKAAEDFSADFKWDGAAVEVEDGRFVEYNVNKAGKISKLTPMSFTKYFIDAEYNADTEILYGNFIDNNTIVFVITEDEIEENYVTDIDYLIDEGTYTGALYIKNGDTKVVVVIDTDMAYSNDNGFAIATNVSQTIDEDNETVYAVEYVQNEEEGIVYFEEDITDEFTAGTVFIFNTTTNNYVNKYEIVASIENYEFVEETTTDIGKDVEVVFGYIENDSRKTNSKGELITVNDETYIISSMTNKYTYTDSRNKIVIETEDFLSGNAYYANDEYITPVMLKLIDGVVVDIYTISINID